MKRVIAMIVLALGLGAALPARADVPEAAHRYHRELVGQARQVWGMDAPVAAFGAQIQQESGWNPAAHSSVAAGLAEFTPATAAWISGAYPDRLGGADPYNPGWAIRALTIYDFKLWGNTAGASPCDHMAFVLSAYNGGLGWVYRDQALAKSHGADPARWFDAVALFTARAPAAARENRGYPQRILLVLQPSYVAWGGAIDCSQAPR
ncbi:MAG TPA: transglycosylase SLT domain-containing protein [Gammaproteobacteria bacterium]